MNKALKYQIWREIESIAIKHELSNKDFAELLGDVGAKKEDVYTFCHFILPRIEAELKKEVLPVFEIPSSTERVTHCPDCNTKIVVDCSEIDYVCCSGCPRIFNRINEVSR
jgi:hypothetical protein